jgi:hypothetical protein
MTVLTGGTQVTGRERREMSGVGWFGLFAPGLRVGPSGLASSFSFLFCSVFFFFCFLISCLKMLYKLDLNKFKSDHF